jgi:hypothetical protein
VCGVSAQLHNHVEQAFLPSLLQDAGTSTASRSSAVLWLA